MTNDLFGIKRGDLVVCRDGFKVMTGVVKYIFSDQIRVLIVPDFEKENFNLDDSPGEVCSLADCSIIKRNYVS